MTSLTKLTIDLGIIFIWMTLQSCLSDTKTNTTQQVVQEEALLKSDNFIKKNNDSLDETAMIFPPHEVPVLCYHNIKKKVDKNVVYAVSEAEFAAHIKMLSDSGYQSVLPDQLYQYFTEQKPLPLKPVMLSFDDTRIEHFTKAVPEMKKYGYKGVFFIMNICIGKPGYMTEEQIRILSEGGHAIGCHTWDHHNVKALHGKDWDIQIDLPKENLEQITGKPVAYFAYPFGVWDDTAIYELKKRGIKAAFQLNGRKSKKEPLYTIRRMVVPCGWSAVRLHSLMRAEFK